MEDIASYIFTALGSLIVGLLLQRFRDRAKLLYWIPGSFLFHLKNPDLALRTDSLTIQNVGRLPATNVEIVHQAKPDHFQFSNPVDFIESINPTGEHIIKVASLGPKEHINLQLLSHKALPVLLNVRCAEGKADAISVQLQRVYPRVVLFLVGMVMLLGAAFLLYWVIAAVLYLSKAIGVLA